MLCFILAFCFFSTLWSKKFTVFSERELDSMPVHLSSVSSVTFVRPTQPLYLEKFQKNSFSRINWLEHLLLPVGKFLQYESGFIFQWREIVCHSTPKRKKVKVFPYSVPSVGPRAVPGVQAVSLQVTISHPLGGRLPLLSARPTVTSPATDHHRPLAGTKLYCLVTEAHRCEQLAQGFYKTLPRAGFEPVTYWSQVQRSTRCTTAPPIAPLWTDNDLVFVMVASWKPSC